MDYSANPSNRTFPAQKSRSVCSDEVVELGLLLPSARAEELFALAKRRGSSVAQVLRGMIDNALAAESLN